MDLSIITPRGNSELILRVIDGKPVVIPPPARPAPYAPLEAQAPAPLPLQELR